MERTIQKRLFLFPIMMFVLLITGNNVYAQPVFREPVDSAGKIMIAPTFGVDYLSVEEVYQRNFSMMSGNTGGCGNYGSMSSSRYNDTWFVRQNFNHIPGCVPYYNVDLGSYIIGDVREALDVTLNSLTMGNQNFIQSTFPNTLDISMGLSERSPTRGGSVGIGNYDYIASGGSSGSN